MVRIFADSRPVGADMPPVNWVGTFTWMYGHINVWDTNTGRMLYAPMPQMTGGSENLRITQLAANCHANEDFIVDGHLLVSAITYRMTLKRMRENNQLAFAAGVHVQQVCAPLGTPNRDGAVRRLAATPSRLAVVRTVWPPGGSATSHDLTIVNYDAIK
ncbi:unnamed protein product [Sphagnum balticum]